MTARHLGLALVIALLGTSRAVADTSAAPKPSLPKVFEKVAPENVADLRAVQAHVRELVKKVVPCTVGVKIGMSMGSGVIINKEGHVLTAGHVSGAAGQNVDIILADGRIVKGKTLGGNQDIDSGLIQITDKGAWPHLEMGKSGELKKGQWCMAVGHPGGFRPGRPPVVRLGRVLENLKGVIRTDCTLVGGDSGGPLFDMDGNVIGINSQIGITLAQNLHVPVDTYRETWDRLAKGEVWGPEPFLGVQFDPDAKICRIHEVLGGSPASKAGLKANDVLLQFDGKKVDSVTQLSDLLRRRRPGHSVSVQVQRGTETITLRLVLGRRPS
jgi:serine protease Do